jgi:hypothetical protein
MEYYQKQNALRVINNAITHWKEKAKGINMWWDKTRYDKEYCLTQVEYFENIKKQYL